MVIRERLVVAGLAVGRRGSWRTNNRANQDQVYYEETERTPPGFVNVHPGHGNSHGRVRCSYSVPGVQSSAKQTIAGQRMTKGCA